MSGPSLPSRADEVASVDRAIATLEAQRGVLGDEVCDTALEPLRARRAELDAPRAEQRRLVTVLFADLVDFTVLSRTLDAEDTREVVGDYFARWRAAIEDQGGVVEKFIGDAVMAVFGLSRSYEDDAHRAIRASLHMLAELEELNAQVEQRYGVRLQMRVGIDTGEVVVSTLGERGDGFVAVGPTVNRAARLQAAAPVDRVLISAETQRQTRGAFGVDVRHGLELKGIDEPVEAFVVTSERRQGFRLDPAGRIEGVETTTVGRDLQLRFLQDRLQDVTEESRWRVVTMMGEAGVGKSRLLYDFDAWLASLPELFWWFRGRATPSSQHGVNSLLRDLLSSRFDISVDDPSDVVGSRFVDGFVDALGSETGRHHAVVVGAWLGFGVLDPTVDVPTDPQALRDQGSEALADYFRALSQRAPVVMLLEDLHWTDEGTLRWLDAVDQALGSTRVFVVATARPSLLDSHPHWGEGLSHHDRLTLAPLTRRESRSLVRQILARVRDLPDDLVELVIDSAEGNPFYIEELVTWLLDAGVVVRGETQWAVEAELVRTVAVPSTLKGVLQARLDALSLEERNLLQRASVVGRVFWDDAVAQLDDGLGDEQDHLASLRRRELLLERAVSVFASSREYLFKHALLRDVAYDGVLRAHRERYHRRAAAWLVETSAAVGRQDEYAAIIAEHYEKAHDPAAAPWYLRAGRQAASVYALSEASRMFASALALAPEDDPGLRLDILVARDEVNDRIGDLEAQQRDLEEMDALADRVDVPRHVQLLMASSRFQFKGSDYAAAVEHATHAAGLAEEAGLEELHTAAMLLLGKALTWANDNDGAREAITTAVEQARTLDRPDLLGEALRYLSMLASNSGDYPPALDYVDQAREAFARTGDAEMVAIALAQKATTLFLMTRYAEAQETLEQTLPIFSRAGHRYRVAINLGNLASIAMMRGHLASSERFAREALDLATELEEAEAVVSYRLVLATVETFTSRLDDARAHLHAAIEVARDLDATPSESEGYYRLVATELAAGDVDTALECGRRAVELSTTAPSDLDRACAQLTLGYAAIESRGWEEARHALTVAASLFDDLELPPSVREASVALAAADAGAGRVDEAIARLEPVLEHLDVAGLLGTHMPGQMLLLCHRVLSAAGDPRAESVREAARRYLHHQAEEAGDADLGAGYLAFPAHAELLTDPPVSR